MDNLEVFYTDPLGDYGEDFVKETVYWLEDDDEAMGAGWFYWFCLPGCMPDTEPFGPFSSKQEAIDDAEGTFGDFDLDEQAKELPPPTQLVD